MSKSKKPTGTAKPARTSRPRAKKWKPPEPEYLDWRTVDLSKLAYAENFTLKEEMATFKEHLEELLRDEGKYVLIKGREIIGIYDDEHEAIREGAIRFGAEPILVKQIAVKERIHTLGGALY